MCPLFNVDSLFINAFTASCDSSSFHTGVCTMLCSYGCMYILREAEHESLAVHCDD